MGKNSRVKINRFGFQVGTKGCLICDLLAAGPVSYEALKRAVDNEYGPLTDKKFARNLKTVRDNLKEMGYCVKSSPMYVLDLSEDTLV